MTLRRIPAVLVWMDLEMTGLEPARDVIVEIAVLITDDNLSILAEGPDLVLSATPEQLDTMSDVVREMHICSGWLEAIKASTISLESAGTAVLDFLRQHIPAANTVPLAG